MSQAAVSHLPLLNRVNMSPYPTVPNSQHTHHHHNQTSFSSSNMSRMGTSANMSSNSTQKQSPVYPTIQAQSNQRGFNNQYGVAGSNLQPSGRTGRGEQVTPSQSPSPTFDLSGGSNPRRKIDNSSQKYKNLKNHIIGQTDIDITSTLQAPLTPTTEQNLRINDFYYHKNGGNGPSNALDRKHTVSANSQGYNDTGSSSTGSGDARSPTSPKMPEFMSNTHFNRHHHQQYPKKQNYPEFNNSSTRSFNRNPLPQRTLYNDRAIMSLNNEHKHYQSSTDQNQLRNNQAEFNDSELRHEELQRQHRHFEQQRYHSRNEHNSQEFEIRQTSDFRIESHYNGSNQESRYSTSDKFKLSSANVHSQSANAHSANNLSANSISTINHSASTISTTNHSVTNHSATNHSATNHSATNHSATNHSATNHSATFPTNYPPVQKPRRSTPINSPTKTESADQKTQHLVCELGRLTNRCLVKSVAQNNSKQFSAYITECRKVLESKGLQEIEPILEKYIQDLIESNTALSQFFNPSLLHSSIHSMQKHAEKVENDENTTAVPKTTESPAADGNFLRIFKAATCLEVLRNTFVKLYTKTEQLSYEIQKNQNYDDYQVPENQRELQNMLQHIRIHFAYHYGFSQAIVDQSEQRDHNLKFYYNRIYTDKSQQTTAQNSSDSIPAECWKTLDTWVPNAKAYKLPENWQGVDPYRSLVEMLEEDEIEQKVEQRVESRIEDYSQEFRKFADQIDNGLKRIDEQIGCLKNRVEQNNRYVPQENSRYGRNQY